MINTSIKQTFLEQGYVVVDDILDPILDIQPLVDDYTQLLDRVANDLYAQGDVPSTYAQYDFKERLAILLNHATRKVYRHLDITLPSQAFTDDSPVGNHSRPVFDLLTNPRILDVVEELIGGEILASPVQHVRIKPPEREVATQINQMGLIGTTGWHQDQGVLREEADETNVVTVWVAITDATLENGCLQVIPGSHHQGMELHCPAGPLYIPDHLLNGGPTPLPIKAGSAIFMHRLTKHASLTNVSDTIRWSFDLRYQPIGVPTGRDEFPSLTVRSRENPAQVQDYDTWRQAWIDTRERLVNQARLSTHRWDSDAPSCA